jgi:CBS domain containing-hemolysin-like protein
VKTEIHIVSMLFCFMGIAFFAGIETGMLCINRARLAHFVRAGYKAAAMVEQRLLDMQSFLATTLIGINLMNVALATFSAGLARMYFRDYPVVQTGWQITMAVAVLFFSEYLPKLFFATRPLRSTLISIRFFNFAEKLLKPLTGLVMLLTQWLMPSKGGDKQRFLMTREFLQNVVSDAKDGSRITAFERMMINRVLTLHTQTAAQLMTPLPRVTKTTADATLEHCYKLVRDSGHTRLPVFDNDSRSCVGVLNVLDTMITAPDPEHTRASEYMQTPLFVDASLPADDVLPLMRKYRKHLALVRAKGGNNVLGIITEENIISALTHSLPNTRVAT